MSDPRSPPTKPTRATDRADVREWAISEWAFGGRSQVAVSEELGLSTSQVNGWVQQYLRKHRPELLKPTVYSWDDTVYGTHIPFYGEARRALVRQTMRHRRVRPAFSLPQRHLPKAFRPQPLPRSRPIDMGGPRDVWLEFWPGPDPRRDYGPGTQRRVP